MLYKLRRSCLTKEIALIQIYTTTLIFIYCLLYLNILICIQQQSYLTIQMF